MEPIEFRVEEGTVTFVEELGLDPSELARELFVAEVRRLRAQERHERLTEADIRLPRPAAEIVREDRRR